MRKLCFNVLLFRIKLAAAAAVCGVGSGCKQPHGARDLIS